VILRAWQDDQISILEKRDTDTMDWHSTVMKMYALEEGELWENKVPLAERLRAAGIVKKGSIEECREDQPDESDIESAF